MVELERKLQLLRQGMRENGLEGLRLRGIDYFAWATGGANSAVSLVREIGCAEVFVTAQNAWVLTSEIEADRLESEEIPSAFHVQRGPWQNKGWMESLVQSQARVVASDRPTGQEKSLPTALVRAKRIMGPQEIIRYDRLGRECAQVAQHALELAQPDWSEHKLAGVTAQLLWERGIHPALTLVGGEERSDKRRHPFPSSQPLGRRALLVICGRRHGLYANLSRWKNWDKLTPEELRKDEAVRAVEAAAFEHSRPGKTLGQVYAAMAAAYEAQGFGEEIHHHHQGGITGYQGREALALPDSQDTLETGMALAWNPSLPSAKVENTMLITSSGLQNLTKERA